MNPIDRYWEALTYTIEYATFPKVCPPVMTVRPILMPYAMMDHFATCWLLVWGE